MRDQDWTKLLGWPEYRVYRQEIEERSRRLKLWVRRAGRKLQCSSCSRELPESSIHEVFEREVRDLPCFQYQTTIVVEMHRLRCPDCGVKVEKIEQLPSKAPFSKRFEEMIGRDCESAAANQVGRRHGLAASTVRAIDLRYLKRWDQTRRKPVLRQMGVDELYLGKKTGFVTVVTNLESSEPIWMGKGRKQETLDRFFQGRSAFQRERIIAACIDMWEAFAASIRLHCPKCKIVYDKFHVMQHANQAVDEVRRAEFFRKKGKLRDLVKGKRWLLLSRWVHLDTEKKRLLNELFALNRGLMKAYLLKESLERLWDYHYEGAMRNYLYKWIDQIKWQRLKPFMELGWMLYNHLEGIMNYCRTKVPFGVVEAVNANLKNLIRRGRGYRNLQYLLLKAQRMTVTNTQFLALQKAA